jgi:sulfur carrier protein
MSTSNNDTTKLMINGQVTHIDKPTPTVTALLAYLNRPANGIAVAVDGHVVPKSQWDVTTLKDGERIEIVAPFQGG